MYNKTLKRAPKFFKNLYVASLLKAFPRYQPIWRKGKIISGNDRDCFDRWELIKSEIKHDGAKNLIDLGSAEGFYVIQAAKECGCVAIGVDADERRISLGQSQLTDERIKNAGFVYAVIDEKFIQSMPVFDVVVFMSVMHHMMARFSFDYSLKILSKIRERTGKFLIFEMGQSDEKKMPWLERLPDMGHDPHAWIAEFLKQAGFRTVEKKGESLSYTKEVSRAIFKAVP